ncbi:MAG: hypothetical protein AB7O24_12940 [Kofleriaceae bacterium]
MSDRSWFVVIVIGTLATVACYQPELERVCTIACCEADPSGCPGGFDCIAGYCTTPDHRCPLVDQGAFSEPTEVQGLNVDASPALDIDPFLSRDRCEMVFSSSRVGGTGSYDLWRTSRQNPRDVWSPPTPLTELNTAGEDRLPKLAADGLSIWFARQNSIGGLDVYASSRASIGAEWSTPVAVSELQVSESNYDQPGGNADEPVAMVITYAFGNDNDLYESTRATTAEPWGTPKPLEALNTPRNETGGHLIGSATVVYFAATNGSHEDLCAATRAASDATFSTPRCFDELNGPSRDQHPWVSTDGRHIVFTSDRLGTSRLFEASR